ncbi:hypothetical protein EHO51_10460 [Methylocystis rosea]|uniref:Uncharacterized protein n=1 Tax=Methylocystis rosea TaxID=173366 RepID=A0A3G8M7G1_9HYPH|nr:hypothetical protein EHO51_10460 [Methylocystis rosea]
MYAIAYARKNVVMAGLVPAIHAGTLRPLCQIGVGHRVDARDKRGHDGGDGSSPSPANGRGHPTPPSSARR